MYPAHEVMKKLGDAGLLGINKPVEYGGLGLDYKYQERGELFCCRWIGIICMCGEWILQFVPSFRIPGMG